METYEFWKNSDFISIYDENGKIDILKLEEEIDFLENLIDITKSKRETKYLEKLKKDINYLKNLKNEEGEKFFSKELSNFCVRTNLVVENK